MFKEFILRSGKLVKKAGLLLPYYSAVVRYYRAFILDDGIVSFYWCFLKPSSQRHHRIARSA